MSPPTTWTQDDEQRFLNMMCRHLVGLGGTYQAFDNGRLTDEKAFMCSCFPLVVGNTWCLATAGHIFTERDQIIGALRAGLVQVNRWGLIDYFGVDVAAGAREPTAFLYRDEETFVVHDRPESLDAGLIPLSDYFSDHLQAHFRVPIRRENWTGTEQIDFEGYAVLGLPAEFNEPITRQGDRGQEQLGLCVEPALVWVERLSQLPPGVSLPGNDWFIGRVQTTFHLRGMSGGPIFGFYRDSDGALRYKVVAMQSSQLDVNPIIRGCPILRFMQVVEDGLIDYMRRTGSREL